MNRKLMKAMAVSAGLASLLAVTSCDGGGPSPEAVKVNDQAAKQKAYLPVNGVELKNYNRAQEIYDDPNSIQWCTAFPSSASAPIFTTPIAGKLTTSNTSYFSPTSVGKYGSNAAPINEPSRSVDAMFHGESFYRYGFTPGGALVDYSNSMELMCSTVMTDFQRQKTFIESATLDGDIDARQKQAEAALKAGNPAKAAQILKGK